MPGVPAKLSCRSRRSRFEPLNWTTKVVDFPALVRVVQVVQVKMKIDRIILGASGHPPLPCSTRAPRAAKRICQKSLVRLVHLDHANFFNGLHGPSIYNGQGMTWTTSASKLSSALVSSAGSRSKS